MSVSHFLSILRARWFSALAVCLGVIGLVGSFTVLSTPKYTATASVLLDVKSSDPIGGTVQPTTSGYMVTQTDVFQSERVILGAIHALRLEQSSDLRDRWRQSTGGTGNFESWLAERMLTSLDVRPGRDSNVVMINYTSPDPVFSATMANAIVKSYTDTTLQIRVEPAKQYNGYFEERAGNLRDALQDAKRKLSDYQREKGIIATDERLDIESARLSELSSQLVSIQALAEESASRERQSAVSADQMQEVLNNPVVGSLTAELSRQEARLNEMNSRLGRQNPQVVELEANLTQLRSRIASETQRVAGSLTVNNKVNESRVAQIKAALDQQRIKVLQIKGQRNEAGVLSGDVDNAQRAYDAILMRANQSTNESLNTQTNVMVLKQASAPADPSSPRVMLNTAVSIVLGVLLGLATAAVRETLDRRLRFDEDILVELNEPLLGNLPMRKGIGRKSTSRMAQINPIAGVLPHAVLR